MGYTHGISMDSPTRICTKCNTELPNTNEYFTYADRKTGRLNAVCKTCQSKITKEKRLKMIERNKDKDLFYEGTRRCKNCGRDLPNNKLYFPIDLSCVDGIRSVCRECSKKEVGFLDPDYTVAEKWTQAEDELMFKYYKHYTGKELHEKFFPNRTVRSIECRADVLGLCGKTDECRKRMYKELAEHNSIVLKGRVRSEEWCRKISEAKKKYFETHDGWMKGRTFSEEHRRKISERMKGNWAGDKNPRHINPLCGELNGRWKGGINDTYSELRSDTKDWFNESMEFCNYSCVVTNGEFDNVHHTTAFRDIVDEVFKLTNISVQQKVCDYSQADFDELRSVLKDLHTLYGYGACINKDVHKLFHDNYGYTNFSPFDFLDFIYRIDIGEFDEWFEENQLKIDINYDYVDYLESTLTTLAESA